MVFARGDVSGHDDQTLGTDGPCMIPGVKAASAINTHADTA